MANRHDFEGDTIFEDEVRRIARALWPSAEYDGARIVKGRERDGVFETEENIHLVEATTSGSKDKAKNDSQKLKDLCKHFRNQSAQKAIQCWLITKNEPTAEQRGAAKAIDPSIRLSSFSQFQSKLIDAHEYLACRDRYPFGSIKNPANDDIDPKQIKFIPLDILKDGTSETWGIDSIADKMLENGRVVLLGDYGAGKSMTLWEVFTRLKRHYETSRTLKFPIYINLRDHYGQTNPAEVLDRHSMSIGFKNPNQLVRAWRAGYAILILDGFDELATLGIQGLWKKLKDIRYRSMEIIRKFIQSSPGDAGILLAGRAHYFDNEKERLNALGLGSGFVQLTLNDYSDSQIKQYLDENGYKGAIPKWMPSRPLLVGYLVAKRFIQKLIESADNEISDPAIGWNFLLDEISEREAAIEAGIDGTTIRNIIERLATKARSTPAGLGPLSQDQLIDAFKEICGYPPQEQALVLLQRLPGLGIYSSADHSRSFIDKDLADACRAGDVHRYIFDPFNFNGDIFKEIQCPLYSIGISVSVMHIDKRSVSIKKLSAAIEESIEHLESAISADLVRIAIERGDDIGESINIRNSIIPELELSVEMGDCSKLSFVDCYFSYVSIDNNSIAAKLPKFRQCIIDEMVGRVSRKDLPSEVFDQNCIINSFSEEIKSTSDILNLSLSAGVKTILTILNKIYFQRGSGRLDSALGRGLDHECQRLVPNALHMLENEGLILRYRRKNATIWCPVRHQQARVQKIILAPTAESDPIFFKAKLL